MPAQSSFASRLPALSYLLLAIYLVILAFRTHNDTTIALVIASVVMFACCWASATHLLGARPALQFVLIAVSFGWFAEQMGSSRGWFFGHYTYTDVLGPRLGDVPLVIPLMWFALTYAGYVIANLIVWQSPVDGARGLGNTIMLSFLAAMIVTAFDLGADPYMVYTLKAWIMTKTDGAWFGETVQGFFGWVFVSFVIILGFRMSVRSLAMQPSSPFLRHHALVPLALYGSNMVFQMMLGNPVEIRSIAPFAMGIPLLCALAGYQRWVAPAKAPV
jgi:putative membrane protein